MRVLMLAQFYRPIIGGEEQAVRDLSIELVARGHDVAVATLWQQGMPRFEIDEGVRIYRLRSTVQRLPVLFSDTAKRGAPPLPDPEALRDLHRVVQYESPDVVHAHNWLMHSYLPLKPWSGAPLVLTVHDFSLTCPKKKLMYRDAPCDGPALRRCLECGVDHYGLGKGIITVLGKRAMSPAEDAAVDMFLPVSRAVAEGTGLAGSRRPYEVIPDFAPDAIESLADESDPRLDALPIGDFLLFVGALGAYKGLDVLLRAYADLTTRRADLPPLVLVGYPCPDTPTSYPSNVLAFQSWPRPTVMAAFRRAMAAIFPSVWAEPFGIVALEAMAAGRPIIASRFGGLIDLVDDGETGLLVPPSDPTALAAAVERLIDNPNLHARMGAAGRRKLQAFKAGAVVPRIEAVYERLLAARGRQRPTPARRPVVSAPAERPTLGVSA